MKPDGDEEVGCSPPKRTGATKPEVSVDMDGRSKAIWKVNRESIVTKLCFKILRNALYLKAYG